MSRCPREVTFEEFYEAWGNRQLTLDHKLAGDDVGRLVEADRMQMRVMFGGRPWAKWGAMNRACDNRGEVDE